MLKLKLVKNIYLYKYKCLNLLGKNIKAISAGNKILSKKFWTFQEKLGNFKIIQTF